MFAVKLMPAAFTTTVGTTPITFESRHGKWRAVCGQFGTVEIWGATREELRQEVQAIYGRPVHAHQRASWLVD